MEPRSKNPFVRMREWLLDFVKDDARRRYTQEAILMGIFATVAAFMMVLNVFSTYDSALTWVTGGFAVVTLALLVLHYFKGVPQKIAIWGFCVETVAMFTYFIISGQPEGFSLIWLCLLPSLTILLLGRAQGSIVSGAMFLILAFFFYIPYGRTLLQYEYPQATLNRFPIAYLVFFALALILETIRHATFRQFMKTQSEYQYLSHHDELTHLYNRYGFYERQKALFEQQKGGFALAMFDLDFFKRINDEYGHVEGDRVLAMVAETMAGFFPKDVVVARWGGEEFVALFPKGEEAESLCEGIAYAIRKKSLSIQGNEVSITLSLGLVKVAPEAACDFVELIRQADSNLYIAKETGRDKIVVSDWFA